MATLANLIPRVADILDEPAKTLRSRAMFLRKANMLTSEGHGRQAAMDAADAINLLLATLIGGHSIDAAIDVRTVRQSVENATSKRTQRPPLRSVAGLRKPHMLGDMLDAVFGELVCCGQLVSTEDGALIEIDEVRVARDYYALRTHLTLKGKQCSWMLDYTCIHPDMAYFPDEKQRKVLLTRSREGTTGRRIEQAVDAHVFYALASCLRDEPYREQWLSSRSRYWGME